MEDGPYHSPIHITSSYIVAYRPFAVYVQEGATNIVSFVVHIPM